MLLWLTLLALHRVPTVRAQFFRDCTTQEALANKRCCPSTDGSECGKDSGRGKCEVYQGSGQVVEDKRLDWPSNFYNEICVCNYPFFGPDCGRCDYNHHLKDCSQPNLVVRQEIRNLSDSDRQGFIDALNLAKTTRSERYVILAGGSIEDDPTTYTFRDGSIMDCAIASHELNSMFVFEGGDWTPPDLIHRSSAFCTWHRYFILSLEQELQELTSNPDFAMPYWDWTTDDGCGLICTDKYMGASLADGSLSPYSTFSQWEVACGDSDSASVCLEDTSEVRYISREPGEHAQSLSTMTELTELLTFSRYDTDPYSVESNGSFRNCLEGFKDAFDGVTDANINHNRAHEFLGGLMLNTALAVNDPIFWLVHTNADRVLESWIKFQRATPNNYPENGIRGQGPNDNVFPALPPQKNKDFLQDSEGFGYIYDALI